jgi:small conductance mechanosensitive channel
MENLPLVFQTLILDFLTFLPKLAVAIVILIITLVLAGLANRLIRRALAARGANVQVTQVLTQLARWAILALGVVTALQQVNFDVTGLVAGLGIVGFALGFALQDIAANFVSGVILLVQQPFQPGDMIETGGFVGRVRAVDLRTTQLRTLDGQDVLIPNGMVLSNAITNFDKSPSSRVAVNMGVAYGSDLEIVRKIAIESVATVRGVVETPDQPFVRFHTFGSSSIELTVYFWVDSEQNHPLDAKDMGLTRIKAAFEQAGIEIPYPIRTIYVHDLKGN